MQAKRRIAIIYEYNENWIASAYYIQNLISALNYVRDYDKPEILLITKSRENFEKVQKITGYPFLIFRKFSVWERFINSYLSQALFRNFIGSKIWSEYRGIDVLFPANSGVSFSFCKNLLYWIADFQEHYLPAFFSENEIAKRESIQKKIVENGKYLVLSSQSAKNDFNRIYPENRIKQFVLPFAVTHPVLPEISREYIFLKYGITKRYFICSNQFWKHKNHIIVLQAISFLKRKGVDFFVVFTGQKNDYRNPLFFQELEALIVKLEIVENVSFLGFIKREEQLSLMKYSIAVIQPSLFEGWSTVIEDAKALKVRVIASDISVHQEQLSNYIGKCFFDPADAEELGKCIEEASSTDTIIEYDYQNDIQKYCDEFVKILRSL